MLNNPQNGHIFIFACISKSVTQKQAIINSPLGDKLHNFLNLQLFPLTVPYTNGDEY